VVADLRAGVDVGESGEVEFVLAAGDGGDVDAVAQVGEVLAVQGDGAGRAEDQAGAGQGGFAVACDGEALGEGLGAADGVDVEDGDLDALGMQEPGDRAAELAEADHQGGAAIEDVTAIAHDGLGGKDDRLADEEVLGVLQRGAGDGDDGAGQFVEVLVAAVPVLGVLDHPGEPAGEPAVDLGEAGGEVAADVQQGDRLVGGTGFEVVQSVAGLGEHFAGEGVDHVRLLDLALRGRVDGLRLGQHRGEPGHRGDSADERGTLGQQVRDEERRRLLTRGELGGDSGEVGVQPGAFESFHGSSVSSVPSGGRARRCGFSECGRVRTAAGSAASAASR
jgi:hypothetical protein